MKKLTLLIISSLLLVGTSHAQKGGVAILDIDAVARELGVEDSVKTLLQTMQDNLNIELKKTQASFQAQMKNIETLAGPNPNEDQKAQLLQANQRLNSEFNKLRQQAQRTLQQERITRINQFREKLKPLALEAAKAKGLDVVIMKVTPPVYAYSDSVDITVDTAARAVKAGLKEKTSVKPAATPAVTPAKPAAAPTAIPAPAKPAAKPAKPNE